MVEIFSGSVTIKNTRSGGQNPNVLGAEYDGSGNFNPVLSVNGGGLKYYVWNIVPTIPGFLNVSPSYIQMTGNGGKIYNLGVAVQASGSLCVMNEVGRTPAGTVFDQWYFPYPTRLLLAYNLIDEGQQKFSLDAGKYPRPIIYDFNSSVEQTWQIAQAS
ncbi:hypothetical protein U1769_06785 [Sphingomonas sp. ZT3P38]|uniref:hypothetical protein n=1 Tax=Parasphingomonas zepuensis TaxID=3096161 RepID=UPI002FCBE0FB